MPSRKLGWTRPFTGLAGKGTQCSAFEVHMMRHANDWLSLVFLLDPLLVGALLLGGPGDWEANRDLAVI